MYFKISFGGISKEDGYHLLISLIRESIFHLSFSLFTQLLDLKTSALDSNWLYIAMTMETVLELDYEDAVEDDYVFVRNIYSVLNLGFENVAIDVFIH